LTVHDGRENRHCVIIIIIIIIEIFTEIFADFALCAYA